MGELKVKKKEVNIEKIISWYSEENNNGTQIIRAIYEDDVEKIEFTDTIKNELMNNNIITNITNGVNYRFDKIRNAIVKSDYFASNWEIVPEIKDDDRIGIWYSIII